MSDIDRTHDHADETAVHTTAGSAARPVDALLDAATADAAPSEAARSDSTEPETAPQPLTSLSSLLGGSFAGGQACDADGNCD